MNNKRGGKKSYNQDPPKKAEAPKLSTDPKIDLSFYDQPAKAEAPEKAAPSKQHKTKQDKTEAGGDSKQTREQNQAKKE